jgi:hypothetical protein
MYMTTIQEKQSVFWKELELKRLQTAIELELKRTQAKEAADTKKEQYKTELEEKLAVADVQIDLAEFNKIVAELQGKHAAVIDLMVINSNICVFSQKRSI